MFAKLFRSRRTAKTLRRQPSRGAFRPALEGFEDRLMPATFNWFQAVDGNFGDPARWRDQNGNPGVPGPGDNAGFGGSGYTVTVTGAHAVNRLNADTRLVINPGASLTLANVNEDSRINQFVLQGALSTTGGTTSLNGGSDLRGTLSAAAGAAVVFGNSTHQLNAGAAFTGAGRFVLAAVLSTNVAFGTAVNLELASSGNLTGAANFTANSGLTWTGGGMSGTGQTVLPGGTALTVSGAGEKFLDRRTLTTNGNTVVTGTGRFALGNGATWNNAGVLDMQSDADFIYTFGSNPGLTFNNSGTFRKSAGGPADSTFVSNGVVFNNTGAVVVQDGTLQLDGGGTASSAFTTSAGTNLVFGNNSNNTYTLAAGSSLAGAGTARLQNGTLNVTGSVPATNFSLEGGSQAGTGTLTVSGTFSWSGGGLGGTGQTVLAAADALTVSGPAEKFLDRRTLVTQGDTTVTGTGRFALGNGATWNNAGAFDAQSDADFIYAFGSNPGLTFNNAGTFRKSAGGPADSTFVSNGVVFNNTGAVVVQDGTLTLAGGGTASGGLGVSAGANLTFEQNTYTLAAGADLSGGGTARIRGNGTLNVMGDVSATNVALEGSGGLTGPATLTVTVSLTWTGGGLGGTGVTVVDLGATLTVSGPAEKFLDRRTLTTQGDTTVVPSGTGRFAVGNGATWNNAGAFDAQSDADFIYAFGSNPGLTFNNAGTFRKSAGGPADSTFVSNGVVFNNTGAVVVQDGTLALEGGGASTGAFDVAATGVLRFVGGTYTVSAGAAFTGDGFSRVAGGTLNVGADVTALNFGLDGGTLTGPGTLTVFVYLDWTGGTMADANGVTHLDFFATLSINGNTGKAVSGRTLNLDGYTQWYDSGSINLSNNATINNAGFFDIAHLTDLSMSGAGILNNAGFLLKTGPGRTTLAVTFSNNGGYVGVYDGSLSVNGVYNQNTGYTEVYTTLAANVDLRGGDFVLLGQITGNVTVSGAAAVLQATGSITGDLTNGGIVHVGGAGAAGILTVGGNFTNQGLGVLNMELGGRTAGTEYDQLRVIGTATLNGTLNVDLINGFVVSAGDAFRVLQAGSRSGTFAVLNLPSIGPMSWNPQYDANGLTLAAV